MFEAGALSKSIDKSLVIPLLFGISPAEMKGPLVQFQAVVFGKEEIRKLIGTINSALEKQALSNSLLDSIFETWWPALESQVNKVLDESRRSKPAVLRSDRELLEELLEIARSTNYRNIRPHLNFDDRLFYSVDDLALADDIHNKLRAHDIRYVGELVQKSEAEIIGICDQDKESVAEIKWALACQGLSLGMHIGSGRTGVIKPRLRYSDYLFLGRS